MVENIEEKQKKEEEEEQQEKKKVTWFQTVPTMWKVIAAIVIFLQFQRLSASGGNLQQLWVWIIAMLIILYFMGSAGKRQSEHLLTPREAKEALWKELKLMIKHGEISRFARIEVGPNIGWFVYEGMPKHYVIRVKIVEDNLPRYYKAIVLAEGDGRGYVTLQGHAGDVQGDEATPVTTPSFFKKMKEYDVDFESFFTGRRGKKR